MLLAMIGKTRGVVILGGQEVRYIPAFRFYRFIIYMISPIREI